VWIVFPLVTFENCISLIIGEPNLLPQVIDLGLVVVSNSNQKKTRPISVAQATDLFWTFQGPNYVSDSLCRNWTPVLIIFDNGFVDGLVEAGEQLGHS